MRVVSQHTAIAEMENNQTLLTTIQSFRLRYTTPHWTKWSLSGTILLALLSNLLTIVALTGTKQGVGRKVRFYILNLSLVGLMMAPTLAIELIFSRCAYTSSSLSSIWTLTSSRRA
jgi:hypothetical protein